MKLFFYILLTIQFLTASAFSQSNNCESFYSTVSIETKQNSQKSEDEIARKIDTNVKTILQIIRLSPHAARSAAQFVSIKTKSLLDKSSQLALESSSKITEFDKSVLTSYGKNRDEFMALLKQLEGAGQSQWNLFKSKPNVLSIAKQAVTLLNQIKEIEKNNLQPMAEKIEKFLDDAQDLLNKLETESEILTATTDRLAVEGQSLTFSKPDSFEALFGHVLPNIMSLNENLLTSITILRSAANLLSAEINSISTFENDINGIKFNLVPLLAVTKDEKLKPFIDFLQGKDVVCEVKTQCLNRPLVVNEWVSLPSEWFFLADNSYYIKGKVMGRFPDGKYSIRYQDSWGTQRIRTIKRNELAVQDPDAQVEGLWMGQKVTSTKGLEIQVVGILPNGKIIGEYTDRWGSSRRVKFARSDLSNN